MTKALPKKADRPVIKIEECEEPEIQYLATPELFVEIHEWLAKRGGIKKKAEADSATYYDTRNYRLLREGIEYRVKEKGGYQRHDMKLPQDPAMREVVPDSNDIVHRHELKFKTEAGKPDLRVFWGLAILTPIVNRLKKQFFNKELIAQFKSIFFKEKIDHETDCKRSRVEYSFQTGHMETMDGARKTPTLHILELELREGIMEGLLEEKAALEAEFGPKGLKLLTHRKVIMGIGLLEPEMDERQAASFRDAKIRNTKAYAAAVEEAGYRLAA